MKCVKCGNELGENDKFCPICGTPAKKVNEEVKNQNTYTYDRPVNQQANNYGQPNNYRQANNYGQPNNYGQTNNYGQPNNYRQNNNYGQQYGKSKDISIIKRCLIIAIVIIILASLFVIGRAIIKEINGTKDNKSLSNDYSTTNSDTSTSENGTNTTTSASTLKSNSYKVNYGGFKLYIPDTLTYESDTTNNMMTIADTKSTWVSYLAIQQVSFEKIKQNKSYISTIMMQNLPGTTISNVTVETIDGVEYILLEANMSGVNWLGGIAELNSMYSVCFEIINENGDIDKDIVKNLSPIIKNAEYIGDSTYMKVDESINITDINKAFKAVIEEKNADEE